MIHNSCAKRVKNLKIVGEDTVVCCELINQEIGVNDKPLTMDTEQCQVKIKSKEELFMMVIEQKDVIIDELRERINLLEQKISMMNEINMLKVQKNNRLKTTDKVGIDKSEGRTYGAGEDTGKKTKNVNKNNQDKRPEITEKQCSTALLGVQTQKRCSEPINLDMEGNEPNITEGSDLNEREDWATVVYKHRRKPTRGQQTIVGEMKSGDGPATLKAIPRLAHLHVYKLEPNTTADEVQKFLKDRFPEVKCEPMKSKYPELYASFKVTVDMSNLDEAMNPSVWPQGTCINKFFYLRNVKNLIK